jgi:hypothetical protein
MYYKIEEDGNWNVGNRIDFPDGTTLNSENRLSSQNMVGFGMTNRLKNIWIG